MGKKVDGTNNLLGEISDKLDENKIDEKDLPYDITAFDEAFGNTKQIFYDALASFETTKNDLLSLTTGIDKPVFTASGECALTIPVFNKNIQIDFSKVSVLRAPLQFFLNIFLLILTIKLYTAIARDITKYFISGGD